MGRLVAASVLGGLALLASGCGRAEAYEAFTLEEHDKIIAEGPGCSAECVVAGATKRSCTVKGPECRVICQALADCRVDGDRPMKVCVAMKAR